MEENPIDARIGLSSLQREAEEARLWAEEEAQVAAEKAHLEEECTWEQECLAEEARVWAEEEAQMQEEEEWDTVEQDLHQVGGSSKGKVPQ